MLTFTHTQKKYIQARTLSRLFVRSLKSNTPWFWHGVWRLWNVLFQITTMCDWIGKNKKLFWKHFHKCDHSYIVLYRTPHRAMPPQRRRRRRIQGCEREHCTIFMSHANLSAIAFFLFRIKPTTKQTHACRGKHRRTSRSSIGKAMENTNARVRNAMLIQNKLSIRIRVCVCMSTADCIEMYTIYDKTSGEIHHTRGVILLIFALTLTSWIEFDISNRNNS